MSAPSLRDEFIEGATSPSAWFTHAQHLERSAALLWEPIDQTFSAISAVVDRPDAREDKRVDYELLFHAHAYLLVAGFALETMLKAAAVQLAMNRSGVQGVISDAPRLQTWLKTHNLRHLAVRVSLECDEARLKILDRFTKYIVWAGRYPIPIEPPGLERTGHDYQIASHDRTEFLYLFGLAKDAYLSARGQAGAHVGADVGEYERQKAQWMGTCGPWLRRVLGVLIQQATSLGNGECGVLQIRIDTPEMQRMIDASPRTMLVMLPTTWLPAAEFVRIISAEHPSGMGAENGRRWSEMLQSMNPSQDAALFLCSTPDVSGRWFSRFLVVIKGVLREG